MSVTLQAAFHLGRDYLQNLRSIKNQSSKIRRRSQVCPRLTGISCCGKNHSSLLCDRAGQILESQTYVFSDSVLCLGGIRTEPVQAWYLETRHLKELDRIDGEPMEFEWTNFTGFTSLGIPAGIQKRKDHLHVHV